MVGGGVRVSSNLEEAKVQRSWDLKSPFLQHLRVVPENHRPQIFFPGSPEFHWPFPSPPAPCSDPMILHLPCPLAGHLPALLRKEQILDLSAFLGPQAVPLPLPGLLIPFSACFPVGFLSKESLPSMSKRLQTVFLAFRLYTCQPRISLALGVEGCVCV